MGLGPGPRDREGAPVSGHDEPETSFDHLSLQSGEPELAKG